MNSEQRLDNIDIRLERLVTASEQQGRNIESIGEKVDALTGQVGLLTESMTEFRQDMKQSMAEFRQDMKQSMTEFRQDMKQSMAEFRQDMKQSMAEFRQDMTNLKVMVERQAETAERQEHNIDRLVGIVETLVQRSSQ
jgi:uncharacterized protein YecA (UPF0149 family)